MRFSERAAFSLAIFGFAAILLHQTLGLRGDVALVPRIFGGLLLVFCGIQALMDLFPAAARRLSFLDRKLSPQMVAAEEEEGGANPWATYIFFAWIAGFVLLVYLTSMLWGTVIALFLYLKWIGKESWMLTVLYCSGAALFIYGVFVVGFGLHYFL